MTSTHKNLKIPVEVFQNFDMEQIVNIVVSTFGDYSSLNSLNFGTITFNPIDNIAQLYDEKNTLYGQRLKEMDEMILRLEKSISLKR
ncbi:MAG: hypothetical protein KF870_16690 [Leadbetterella sp.]|nr:hypothetical protein [Leadbetterella sp.]